LHKDRGLPTLAGKCYVFNGLTHDSYVVEYQRKPGCMSHDTYENVEEMPWSVKQMTLRDLLAEVKKEMGQNAVVDFDRDIATTATCPCGEHKEIFKPIHKLKGQDLVCPGCGKTMDFDAVHSLTGAEDFLDKTAFDIGIPPLHIVSGRCGTQIRYFEFSADAEEIFLDL